MKTLNSRLSRLLLTSAIGLGAAVLWLAVLTPPRVLRAAPPALGAAAGQTFTVTSNADVSDVNPGDGVCETVPHSGICTLRAALQEANALPDADTILLQAHTQYVLGHPTGNPLYDGNLDISHTVTLLGAGPDSTVIDGNGSALHERVFDIISGTVVISGVTIENGFSGNEGGGILNAGWLTIINSHIVSNTADGVNDFGGGIVTFGPLTVTHSLISGNKTGPQNAYGGGISGNGVGALYIFDSVISDNFTTGTVGLGGGVYGFGRVIDSTISGNSATLGGGLYQPNLGMVIINSTLANNNARKAGGGLYNAYGPMKLFNVSVTNNLANSDERGTARGGGVAVAGGTFDFTNSIIAGNNKVVVPGPFLIADDCYGTLTSGGFNIMLAVDTFNCNVSNYATADPLLGPLQDNGGPTPTQALLQGSPAIDAGNPSGCTDDVGAALATDQRGFGRPINGNGKCDIGAFEFPHLLDLPLVRR